MFEWLQHLVPSEYESATGTNAVAVFGCTIGAWILTRRWWILRQNAETQDDWNNVYLHAVWACAAALIASRFAFWQGYYFFRAAEMHEAAEWFLYAQAIPAVITVGIGAANALKMRFSFERRFKSWWLLTIVALLLFVYLVSTYSPRLVGGA